MEVTAMMKDNHETHTPWCRRHCTDDFRRSPTERQAWRTQTGKLSRWSKPARIQDTSRGDTRAEA